MELFASALMGIQVVSSLSIILLVLLQQGKGADMGSSFGGGSAGSLFGASGAANFLSRMTKWAAVIFFASTIGLAWVSHHPTGSVLDGGIMQGFERQEPARPTGSEVPGAEVPAAGGAASPVPGNGSSVPETPEVPSAAQSPEVPQAESAGSNEGTPEAVSESNQSVPEISPADSDTGEASVAAPDTVENN